MDFGLLPPEVNSSRMYSGPGPESMLAAAAAWDGVAAELTSAAVSYGSVVSTLIVEPWMGPAAAAMAAAATPYVGGWPPRRRWRRRRPHRRGQRRKRLGRRSR